MPLNKILLKCFLLLTFVHLFSCSAGNGGVKVTAKIFSASATTAMLFAENTQGKRISKLIPVGGSDQKISLPNGTWTFAIIGWDGSNPFEGTASCFTKTQTLSGADVSIDAELSAANCAASVFGGVGNSDASLGFKAVTLFVCNTLTNVSGSSSTCDGSERGFHRSFKISTLEYDQTVNLSTSVAMESACISIGSTLSSAGTTLRLPQAQSGLLTFNVKAYEDSNCTNSATSTVLESGFNSGIVKSFTNAAGQMIYLAAKGALQTIKLYTEAGTGTNGSDKPLAPLKLNLNSAGGPYLFYGSPDASSEYALFTAPDFLATSLATRVLATSINPAGNESVTDLIKVGNAGYFIAKSQTEFNYDLFRFDGTSAVRVFAAATPGSAAGATAGILSKLINQGTLIYFGYKATETSDQELCVYDTLTSVTDCSIHNSAFKDVNPIFATAQGVIYRAVEISDSKQKILSFVSPSAHNFLYDLSINQTSTQKTTIDSGFGFNYIHFSGSPSGVVMTILAGLTIGPPLLTDFNSDPVVFDNRVSYIKNANPEFISGSTITDIDTYLGANAPFVIDVGSVDTKVLGATGLYYYLSSNRGLSSGLVNIFAINSSDQSITQISSEVSGTPGYEGTILNGSLYYMINNGSSGVNLYRATGTSSSLVKMINPTPGVVYPMTTINGKIYFTADDGVNGFEPWVSDGTTAGTFMLKDTNPGTGSCYPFFLKNPVGDYALFRCDTTVYRTKGIADSTEIQYYFVSGTQDVTNSTFFDNGYLLGSTDSTSASSTSFYLKASP